jgi:hypothetical protein
MTLTTSLQAKHFRFKAIESYLGNGGYSAGWHEMEMTTSIGNSWKYERQAYSCCIFRDILYRKGEGCGCGPDCDEQIGVCAAILIALVHSLTEGTSPFPEQFDGLVLTSAKGKIASLSFRTYLYNAPSYAVSTSFDRISFRKFGEKLRVMANRLMDLKNVGAVVNFDLFVHHGNRQRGPRECMKPVFSLRIINDGHDQNAIIDNLYIDEEFLSCRKNRGCARCR